MMVLSRLPLLSLDFSDPIRLENSDAPKPSHQRALIFQLRGVIVHSERHRIPVDWKIELNARLLRILSGFWWTQRAGPTAFK